MSIVSAQQTSEGAKVSQLWRTAGSVKLHRSAGQCHERPVWAVRNGNDNGPSLSSKLPFEFGHLESAVRDEAGFGAFDDPKSTPSVRLSR